MSRFNCTCALLVVLTCAAGQARAQTAAPADSHGFIVFLGGNAVGREDVTTQRSPEGLTISGRGRLAPPLDVITTRAEVRYRSDWTPESLLIEAKVQGHSVTLKTSFTGTEALSESVEDGKALAKIDKVSPQTIVVPNIFFGTYEALAQRLAGAEVGSVFPAYVAPQSEITVRVRGVRADRIQSGRTVFAIRRYELSVASPGGDLPMQLWADEAGHLIRLTVPAQSLDVVRDDVAASSSRILTHSNPTDEPVTIPGQGFNIAATLTRPKVAAARNPAVVLLSGASTGDRDSIAAGVPIMSQLAGALANAGFMVLRYDRRGFGQSGGRSESATMSDAAEDVRLMVRYLSAKNDVDSRRIALAGHGEGAWVALLAASREKKVAGVVSLDGPSLIGADLILEQQLHMLDQMKVPDAERPGKIALQKQIHAAVLTGKGWENVPPEMRRQADTPLFQSFLSFDPARVVNDVGQPLLIVHGDQNQEIPVAHANRLADLARKKGGPRAVEVVIVPGVNHILVPAAGNEVSEDGLPAEINISKGVTAAISGWLAKTLPAR